MVDKKRKLTFDESSEEENSKKLRSKIIRLTENKNSFSFSVS